MDGFNLIIQKFINSNKKLLSEEDIQRIRVFASKVQSEKLSTELEKQRKIRNYLDKISFDVNFPETKSDNLESQQSENKRNLNDQLIQKPEKKWTFVRLLISIIIGSVFSYIFYIYNIFPPIERVWIDIFNKALLGNAWLGFILGFTLTYFVTLKRLIAIKRKYVIKTIKTKIAFGVIVGFVVGLCIGYIVSNKNLNRYKIHNGKYKLDTVTGETWILEGSSERRTRERRIVR